MPSAATLAAAAGLALFACPAGAKHAPASVPGIAAQVAGPFEKDIESLSAQQVEGAGVVELGLETGALRRYYRRTITGNPGKAAMPAVTAAGFLAANAARLGLDPARLASDLQLVSEKTSLSGTHFRYQQLLGGVPVYRGDLVVKIANDGELSSVQSNLRLGLQVDTQAVLTADDANRVARETIRPTGKTIGPVTAELRVVDHEGGARLMWVANLPVEAPMGDWLVFVDAKSGDVVGVEDRMLYATADGRVFDPDPRTKMNNASLIDSNDTDAAVPFPAAYDTRTLQDVTLNAGTYSLSGPYARLLEFESPVVAVPTTTDPVNGFLFQRSPSGFEDVNCYFHIDQNQRYIQSLGFTNVNNRVQEIDAHGLSGADNSHYVIASQRLAFGEGGVDDAEDADVVIHEYGHSIQHNIVPSWGGGQEGAMGEGFGDYWAGSYSVSVNPTFEPSFVFTWDGHNAFWPGRVLVDSTKHYPQDCCGQVHASGTLWSSGVTDCLRRVGRPVMDRLVLDHHFALGGTATMADAANQIIQSDLDFYGGAHLSTIIDVFDFWGFVDGASFVPIIAHAPLGDTGNTAGPYTVTATITSATALVPGSAVLNWGIGTFANTTPMTATGNPNEYTADIPGPLSGVEVYYYLSAQNAAGTTTNPAGAPGNFHRFHVGASDASIAGQVRLAGQTQHDGVLVTLQPGGASVLSNLAGDFAFPNLFAGNYSLTATKAGFAPAALPVVLAQSTASTGNDMVLYPQLQNTTCSAAPRAITEGPFGVGDNITVTPTWAVQGVRVQVNITHPNIGDLQVEVRHGVKTVRLHNQTGGTTDNIVGTYPTTLPVSGPGALADFVGDPANGTWTLRTVDPVFGNTGTLQQWCILLTGPADTSVDTGDPAVPGVAAFRGVQNPVRSGEAATIRFWLPRPAPVTLALFDAAGRRVRQITTGSMTAGEHAAVWDGTNDAGHPVGAGVYFYQLRSPAGDLQSKLVVVR